MKYVVYLLIRYPPTMSKSIIYFQLSLAKWYINASFISRLCLMMYRVFKSEISTPENISLKYMDNGKGDKRKFCMIFFSH